MVQVLLGCLVQFSVGVNKPVNKEFFGMYSTPRPTVKGCNSASTSVTDQQHGLLAVSYDQRRKQKIVNPFVLEIKQGSHRDWKTGRTWKNGRAFSSQAKVKEFYPNTGKVWKMI